MPAPEWAQSGLPLVGFLLFIVFWRAQATYWIARSVPSMVVAASGKFPWLKGIANWASGPVPKKGAQILERSGIIIIPLSFLTVGLQTAILAGAGLVRMNWTKFTLAMIPGCIAWAFLYGYGLLAVWTAAVGAVAGNPWAWVALGVMGILATTFVLLRRRRGKVNGPSESPVAFPVSD